MPTMTERVEVRMTPELARVFREATDEERSKYEILLNLRLLDIARRDETLEEVIAAVSRNAQDRGLTPSILEQVLIEK